MTLRRRRIGTGHAGYTGGRTPRCDGAWLQARARDGAIIVRPDEDINATDTDRLTAALAQFISVRAPLVVDLRELRFLTRSGWRALIAVGYWYREAGVPWALVTGAALQRYLNESGESPVLPVTNSVTEALRGVHLGPATRCHRPPIVARQHTRC